MHPKFFLPGFFLVLSLAACTETPKQQPAAPDSPAPAHPAAPKKSMTVNEPTGPVSKRVSDSIYNGEYIERYDNGVIRKRGNIAGGAAHGEWLSFYPSGKLWSKGTYKNGLRQGYGASYYENGKLSSEGYYQDGNFIGVWKFWDEQGNMTTRDYGDGGK